MRAAIASALLLRAGNVLAEPVCLPADGAWCKADCGPENRLEYAQQLGV